MKIHPDQLEGVRPDQTTRTDRGAQTGTAFGDILSQEVAQSAAQSGSQTAKSSAVLPPPGGLEALGTLLGVQSVEATTPATSAENAIMDKVESVLDKWDQYAQNLQGASGQANLKQAYGVLEDIDGTVQQLKSDNPDLAEKYPQLQGMVSELEAMSVTERIKFNRGDYTA
jgi:hypothetical protein